MFLALPSPGPQSGSLFPVPPQLWRLSPCVMPILRSAALPPFCWAFFLAVVLQLWSAAYNLDRYADGFFRNNFCIYLNILNYGILFFVFVVIVVSHLSIISYQFCSLLAMDKIVGLSGHLKR